MRAKHVPALLIACFIMAAIYAPVGQRAAVNRLVVLGGTTAGSQGSGGEIVLHVNGSYSYRVIPAGSHEIRIDLTGGAVPSGADSDLPHLSHEHAGLQPEPFLRERWSHREVAELLPRLTEAPGIQKAQSAPGTVQLALAADTAAERRGGALAGSLPSEIAAVDRVAILPDSGGDTLVHVATTQPVEFTHFELENPPRLVVDLERTVAYKPEEIYPSQAGILKDVRVGQFSVHPSMVTRVVVDLATHEPSSIESEPSGVRIQIQAPGTPAAIALRPVPIASVAPLDNPGSPAVLSPAVDTVNTVATIHSASGAERAPQAGTTAIPQKQAVDLTRPVKVDWEAGNQVTSPNAPQERGGANYPVIAPHSTGVSPNSRENLLAENTPPPQAIEAARAAEVVAGAAQNTQQPLESTIFSTPSYQQAAPVYTGKLISLDLVNADIRTFFRLIHRISGLNIVVDSDVTGTVTLVLDDVPWDQALDLVLKDNDLGKVFEGNVLRIAKVQTLTAEAQSQATLREAKVESEPLVTIFRRLKYAHVCDQSPSMGAGGGSMGGGGGAGAGGGMGQCGGGGAAGAGGGGAVPGVATMLKKFEKGTVLSQRGSIVEDPRDNAIIITDVPSQIPVIESVINKLDTKSKQLSIEVRVILATSNFVRTLSSALNAGTVSRSGNTVTGGSTGTGASAQGNLPTAVPPRLSIGQTLASGFGAYAISNQTARYFINAAIAAAEEHDQARTISRPTIVTQDNVLGEVQQGVQIPIQTNINNTIAVQYVNATLQMSVTPQVTVDNKVFLNIYVNNASIGSFSTFAGPSINTQQATTQVLVPDGGTVVFGGITVTTRGHSANYVPLLGSIPVVGNLFKSSQVNDQNQELLFFVTPTVLPG